MQEALISKKFSLSLVSKIPVLGDILSSRIDSFIEAAEEKKQMKALSIIYENQIVLLHGFIKKSQKTPSQDLEIALKRAKTLR